MDAYEFHKRIGDLLRADQAAGRLADLDSYQDRFPEHPEIVAAEYRALTSSPAWTHASALLPARHQHHYTTVGEIARGGMGAVFHVRDDVLDRDLAMKVVLRPDGDAPDALTTGADPVLQRFVREAKVTAQLDHPGVVPVYELGADNQGHYFFTMRMVKGKTLGEIFELARAGEEGWSRSRVLGVFVRVLETLAFAHEKHIVHRDLKPANIMVGRFGEVYVMDWGLAGATGSSQVHVDPTAVENAPASSDARITTAGAVLGTPAYMPPEQARGTAVDGRADVYAVGAMLYEFLAGVHPYAKPDEPSASVGILRDLLHQAPAPIESLAPGTPPELVAIVERAMARAPDARYQAAGEFARELVRFVEGRVVKAHRTGFWPEFRKWLGRNRGLAASIGAAALCLLLGVVAAVALGVRAELASQRAQRASEVSRRQAYRASIAAAAAELDRQDVQAASQLLRRAPADLRGWEWEYLVNHLDESLARCRGISHAFAPDGERLLVLDRQGVVRAWDFRTGASEVVLQTGSPNDRAWLAAPGRHLIEAVPGEQGTGAWTLRVRPLAMPSRVRDVHFTSPQFDGMTWGGALGTDGWKQNTVLPWILYADRDGVLTFHDVFTDEIRRPALPRHAVARGRSPSGRYVLFDCVDQEQIQVLDLQSLTPCLSVANSRASRVVCAAWTPDETRIVTAAADRQVRQIDARTGSPTGWRQVGGHREVVTALAIHPDGSLLATGGRDHAILLRDMESGALGGVYHGHAGGVSSMSFSEDGRYLVSTGIEGEVRVWSSAGDDLHILHGHASYVYDVTFSPDGRRIYSGGWDGFADEPGHLRVWDAASGDPIVALGDRDHCTFSLGLTADGTRLFASGGERAQKWGGGPISVWDTATGRLLHRWPGAYRRLALSPDGTRLLVDNQRGATLVLDARTGVVLRTLVDSRLKFRDSTPAWSPDGLWIACMDQDTRTFGIWDARSFERRRTCEGHTGGIEGLAFSPDGTCLVSASADHTARVWEVRSGLQQAVLTGHGADVLTASYTADGARILTAGRDGAVRIWDARTYAEILRMTGHESYVIDAVAGPGGRIIATASGDHTVRLWDGSSLRERYRQRGMRRALGTELSPAVEALFERLGDPDAVVAALRADPSFDDRRREVALQIALALAVQRAGLR